MNMKKWLISAVTLTLALSTAGVVTAFALTSDGGSDNTQVPNGGDTAGEGLHGDPTYDEWILDFEGGIGDGKVLTSADDIDPEWISDFGDGNVCDYIHDINGCTAEELEELGNLAATSWIVNPKTVVEGEPELPFVDGEPVTIQECDLAGGTFWATSDGKDGCDIVHDLEDGGEGETQAEPPVVIPTELLPAK